MEEKWIEIAVLVNLYQEALRSIFRDEFRVEYDGGSVSILF